MKEQLLEVYHQWHEKFKAVRSGFPDINLYVPFLMSPNDTYNKQHYKLLVVGQETNEWNSLVDDLRAQMGAYEKFNVGKGYYSTPFWNIMRKLEEALGNEPYSSAWTNISKYDLNGGRSYGEYETTIATLDNILIEEIRILKPEVCIFFTGPAFDYRIMNTFEEVEYLPINGFNFNQLSQLKHPELPILTFRSYHPNYLRRSKQEFNFVEFFGDLIK